MRKEILFKPAFDRRAENYGIGSAEILFLYGDADLLIQFRLMTGWELPHITHEPMKPMPVDLGYHSNVPIYAGQKPISSDCHYLGGPCYYDGSTLAADDVFDALLKEGHEGVWNKLQECYDQTKVRQLEDMKRIENV